MSQGLDNDVLIFPYPSEILIDKFKFFSAVCALRIYKEELKYICKIGGCSVEMLWVVGVGLWRCPCKLLHVVQKTFVKVIFIFILAVGGVCSRNGWRMVWIVDTCVRFHACIPGNQFWLELIFGQTKHIAVVWNMFCARLATKLLRLSIKGWSNKNLTNAKSGKLLSLMVTKSKKVELFPTAWTM